MLSLGVAIRGTHILAQSETCKASTVYWGSRLCSRLRTRSHLQMRNDVLLHTGR